MFLSKHPCTWLEHATSFPGSLLPTNCQLLWKNTARSRNRSSVRQNWLSVPKHLMFGQFDASTIFGLQAASICLGVASNLPESSNGKSYVFSLSCRSTFIACRKRVEIVSSWHWRLEISSEWITFDYSPCLQSYKTHRLPKKKEEKERRRLI